MSNNNQPQNSNYPTDPYLPTSYYPPPPHPGQFVYPPQPPPPPPYAANKPYSSVILLFLAVIYVLAFIFIGYKSVGASLCLGILVSVLVIDWYGFTTLQGWIDWKPATREKRFWLWCLYLCLFEFVLVIYFVRTITMAFSSSVIGAVKPSSKTRVALGLIAGVCVVFVGCAFAPGTSVAPPSMATNAPSSMPHAQNTAVATTTPTFVTKQGTTKPATAAKSAAEATSQAAQPSVAQSASSQETVVQSTPVQSSGQPTQVPAPQPTQPSQSPSTQPTPTQPSVQPTQPPTPQPTQPPAQPTQPPAQPTQPPVVQPTPTPPPAPQPTSPPPAVHTGVNNNPWGYDFTPGNLIYSPPGNFCNFFNCIPSFWNSTNGYVDECNDGMYSHSGGVRGACSWHKGEMRVLYSH